MKIDNEEVLKAIREAIQFLPPEMQFDIYRATTAYLLTGEVQGLNGICKGIFMLMRELIDKRSNK